MTTAQVVQACRELHLPSVAAWATRLAAEAAREDTTHLAFLSAVLEAEVEDCAERRRQRRIREARFPRLKRLQDFRFVGAPTILAAQLRELATESFIDRTENVIFLGEAGTRHTAPPCG